MSYTLSRFHKKLSSTRLLNRIRHFGLRYKCPLCSGPLKGFLDAGLDLPVFKEKKVVGGGSRSNVFCPVCRSMDRERLIYLYLWNKTDMFRRPQDVLHVAPERQLSFKLRHIPHLSYIAVDLFSDLAMARMDLANLAFPDNRFDAIICNHVLEHIPDDARAMSEVHRTLKKGGWAILQVPISLSLYETYEDSSVTAEEDRIREFGQRDHVRLYGQDYADRLKRAGFTVEVFDWTDEKDLFGGEGNVYGLDEREVVYVARKAF